MPSQCWTPSSSKIYCLIFHFFLSNRLFFCFIFQGTYTLGNMYTFKGMPYCYDLYPAATNNMCGRSGFLIHGGGCSGNPSEGCIVIEDQDVRYKIKSGATLKVVG